MQNAQHVFLDVQQPPLPLCPRLSSLVEQYDSGEAGRAVRTCGAARAGTLLCSSESLAIALEPHRRSTRCGFCTAALAAKHEGCCEACGLIAICAACQSAGAVQAHATECAKLAELSGGRPAELSSLVLLCARIVLRGPCAVEETAPLCTNEAAMLETDAGRESLVQLRAAGDGLSSVLAPAPAAGATAAAEAVAASEGAAAASAAARVLLVCCANSHSLTDLTLPLGEQSMGVGLFPRLSLFNHTCAALVAVAVAIAVAVAVAVAAVVAVVVMRRNRARPPLPPLPTPAPLTLTLRRAKVQG